MSYNRSGNFYRPSFFGGFQFFPPVIKALLISNAAVFLGTLFLGSFRLGDFYLEQFFFQSFALWPLGSGFGFWQLFTYMFMHASFTHILFNMLALWMFGMELEHVWGSRKFLIYYMLCGFGGGLANLLVAPMFTSVGPTVGASGAVYGILLAFGMMFPERPIYIYFLLPIKAKYFVVMYMAFEIFSVGSMDGVAHFAHLGGALVGFLYLLADGYQFGSPYHSGTNSGENVFTRMTGFGRQQQSPPTEYYSNVSDAKIYDITEHRRSEEAKAQAQIDEILDKISKNGYQSLSDEEKKILFEASKKLN
ncbi:MAG: rhomboid family intramembrane serine protease [Bacteroidetes bacterium]|nr:rhomboid family intramembrane serine protease [Bacteroidota bacterium]